MTDQPPVEPPRRQSADSPATMPMPPAAGPAAGGPAVTPLPAPRTGWWHETTSTRGGRWALAVAAAAVVALMLVGVGVAGIVVLRTHDSVSLMGQNQKGHLRGLGGQGGQGFGRAPGGQQPQGPGMPGGQGGQGMRGGGLGGLQLGEALHGNVTATINGSTQALAFQRGQVTAVSATSITLKSSDGFVGTYGRSPATISRSAPVNGAQALVLARASDKVALRIMSAPAVGGVGPTS